MNEKERIQMRETDLKVKIAKEKDLPTLMMIEREGYPPDMHANEEKMIERIRTFPQGQFIVYWKNEPVAYATNQLLYFTPHQKPKTWLQYTNGGYIKSTHDPEGNALFYISTAVRPKFRRKGIGSFIYNYRLNLARKMNLEYAFGVFRIQTLRQNLFSIYQITEREFLQLENSKIIKIAKDYLSKIKRGDVKDPLIILFRQGFKILGVVPWYMGDIESLHTGVVLYRKVF
jgi:GNAT superfamily N-acetyltransferase